MNKKINLTPFELFLGGLCLWREAAGEVKEGKIAVAWVIRNRVEHPSWWGKDIWSVLCQPWQFSSLTAKGDSMTVKWPKLNDVVFLECVDIINAVFSGDVLCPVPGADHYYSVSMKVPPKFADEEKFVGQIGMHRFYNLEKD